MGNGALNGGISETSARISAGWLSLAGPWTVRRKVRLGSSHRRSLLAPELQLQQVSHSDSLSRTRGDGGRVCGCRQPVWASLQETLKTWIRCPTWSIRCKVLLAATRILRTVLTFSDRSGGAGGRVFGAFGPDVGGLTEDPQERTSGLGNLWSCAAGPRLDLPDRSSTCGC
jgi:hypothetical protein